MDSFELLIIFIFIIGIGFILYLILRDPILMFKSLLRELKSDDNWKLKILFSPIWIPIWLIDRIFKLRLYIKDFEDASKPKDINFTEYEKYIQVDTDDSDHIEKIINSFHNDYDPKDYNYSLNGAEIKFTQQDEFTILKIGKNIDFNSFNALIQYMDNSAPIYRVYHVKGVLINKQNHTDSYFCFVDSAYLLKLIGKTYRNKKIYVDFDPVKRDNERILFNSNLDYFNNFNFDKFESDLIRMKFKSIEIMPSTQQRV